MKAIITVLALALTGCASCPSAPYYILNMTDASVVATWDRVEAQRWVDSDEGIAIDTSTGRQLQSGGYPARDIPGAK